MSVRQGLLAILADHPAHGYGLKSSFEKKTAGAWPLNVGQVYTTLTRLERDGLVESAGPGKAARQGWQITPAGRASAAEWYESPVDDRSNRDELAIKVLLAIASEGVDVPRILQGQRGAAMERLQRYTRHKTRMDPDQELPGLLLLDALILKAESEIRWLDLCEERLRHRANGASS